MSSKRAVCWIRRDLRLKDHAALSAATQNAEEVAVLFVFDTLILDALQDRDDKRLTFIYDSLLELDQNLRAKGSRLFVAHGDPVVLVPEFVRWLEAEALYFNEDYEPYARSRDTSVVENLKGERVKVECFRDHVIFGSQEVLTKDEMPYRVFTPYSRNWRSKLSPSRLSEHKIDAQRFLQNSPKGFDFPSMEEIGFVRGDLGVQAGQKAAEERLKEFGARAAQYGELRNRIDLDKTSGLSVHLRHGTLSIRKCVRAALEWDNEGADKWLSELIWRDFYQMILAQFPYVVDSAFKPEYESVEWPGSDEVFQRWCDGQTGFPLVDAGMRCLKETGWMHNRLRMITAMFLTKDLHVHWKRGEKHFARYLLDFDLASNNGGWQWSASTGADGQPYFRIFNPVTQSQNYDPEGEFIRKWVPELRRFDSSWVHWPHDAPPLMQLEAGCEIGKDYPFPVVIHKDEAERAKALFKAAVQS